MVLLQDELAKATVTVYIAAALAKKLHAFDGMIRNILLTSVKRAGFTSNDVHVETVDNFSEQPLVTVKRKDVGELPIGISVCSVQNRTTRTIKAGLLLL